MSSVYESNLLITMQYCGGLQHKFTTVYIYRKEKCKQCKEFIDNPTQLPCKHSICAICLDELRDLDQLVCPECKKQIPEDFDPKPPKNKE